MSTEPMSGWTLVEAFVASRPEEAAHVVEGLSYDAAGALLDGAPPAVSALVVSRMSTESGAAALAACAPGRGAAILNRVPSVRATALLRSLERGPRESLLGALGREAAPFRKALSYPAETAAAIMDPKAVTLPDDLSVREARRHVRRHASQVEALVSVVERDGTFVGCVALSALVLNDGATRLSDLADRNTGWIGPSASRLAVLAHPAWAAQPMLPVVDETGILVGSISAATRSRLRGSVTAPSGRPVGAVAAGLAVGELYCITAARLLATLVGTPAPHAEEGR